MDLEKSHIKLFDLMVAIPFLIAGILWISFIAYQTSANAQDINDLKQTKEQQTELLAQIRQDVAVIKAKVSK